MNRKVIDSLIREGFVICSEFVQKECSMYDYSIYFNLVINRIPEILQQLHRSNIKFYVKGGKAVDAYLLGKDKVGFDDWDIVTYDRDSQIEITKNIGRFVSDQMPGSICIQEVSSPDEINEKVIRIGLINEKGSCLQLPVDISVSSKKIDISIMDHIPYISAASLKNQLEETLKDRELAYSKALFEVSQEKEYQVIKKQQKRYVNAVKSVIEHCNFTYPLVEYDEGLDDDVEYETFEEYVREVLLDSNIDPENTYDILKHAKENAESLESAKTKLDVTRNRLLSINRLLA